MLVQGHLTALTQALELGDPLLVGVHGAQGGEQFDTQTVDEVDLQRRFTPDERAKRLTLDEGCGHVPLAIGGLASPVSLDDVGMRDLSQRPVLASDACDVGARGEELQRVLPVVGEVPGPEDLTERATTEVSDELELLVDGLAGTVGHEPVSTGSRKGLGLPCQATQRSSLALVAAT